MDAPKRDSKNREGKSIVVRGLNILGGKTRNHAVWPKRRWEEGNTIGGGGGGYGIFAV